MCKACGCGLTDKKDPGFGKGPKKGKKAAKSASKSAKKK